jgi:cryptochrome
MCATVTSIYWYRNGLRFHDNPGLHEACEKSDTLLPLYVIDPAAPFGRNGVAAAGVVRANFALEAMQQVDDTLRRSSSSSSSSQLIVILGSPEQVVPQVVAALHVTDLYYEREPAAPVRESDRRVFQSIKAEQLQHDCHVHGYDSHTLHAMETYLAKCKGGTAPATYGGFTKLFQSMPIPPEVDDVTMVPPLPSRAVEKLQVAFGNKLFLRVPTLNELGYDDPQALEHRRNKGGLDFIGGESFGLQLLDTMMSRTRWVATFEKPKTSPNALTVDTTGLSPCTYQQQ